MDKSDYDGKGDILLFRVDRTETDTMTELATTNPADPPWLTIRRGTLAAADNGGLFVSPGYGRHPRRCIDSFEIILMREGQMTIAEDDRVFELAQHDALVLLAGRQHQGLSDYDRRTSFYWVHFRLRPKQHAIAATDQSADTNISIPQLSRPGRPERLVELFRRFLHDQEQGFASPVEADLLVTSMLAELAFHHRAEPHGAKAEALAGQVRSFIDGAFCRPDLSPGLVAAELDLNADYLGRVFKRVAGQTLGQYINARRLREARRLLQESDLTVNQVARAAGFADPGYFRRIFRRHFGAKPGDLRRLYFRVHVNVR